MEQFLAAAAEAAKAAGSLIREAWQKTKEIEYKSTLDLVTATDRESEQQIVKILQTRFPDHSILAEEETKITGSERAYRWIVDPLDGTTNFAHSYPQFCVSIALEKDGEIILGLVFDPIRQEQFQAVKGQGATLNGKAIHASKTTDTSKALLATGFPYDRREKMDFYLSFYKAFMMTCHGVRRNGSAALDLCYVASGRLDGFWQFGLYAWDTAAGSLMIREAGGRMSDFSGKEFSVWGEETLASNSLLHPEILHILQEVKMLTPP